MLDDDDNSHALPTALSEKSYSEMSDSSKEQVVKTEGLAKSPSPAHKETRLMSRYKIVVLIVLVIVTAAVSVDTYKFTSAAKQDHFKVRVRSKNVTTGRRPKYRIYIYQNLTHYSSLNPDF